MSKNTRSDDYEDFKRCVAYCVDAKVLRRKNVSPDNPKWKFPDDPKKPGTLARFTLSNKHAKKFASNFEHLAELCTEKEPEAVKNAWRNICVKYRRVYEMINSKLEFGFDKDMLACFVKDADELCDEYFGQTETAGNTNYWHCLQAGHFAEFLETYGNLYRLCQEGWENTNGAISKTYHRKSNKGGGE